MMRILKSLLLGFLITVITVIVLVSLFFAVDSILNKGIEYLLGSMVLVFFLIVTCVFYFEED